MSAALTSWRLEIQRYNARIAVLQLTTNEIKEQLNRFPGLLSFQPTPAGAVRHRMLILTNERLMSSTHLIDSIQLLWRSAHFLAAAHCLRLLFEVWGSLIYARARVVAKIANDPQTADARLQKLLLGTKSAPVLPAGLTDHISVINVMEFIRAGDEAVSNFENSYNFLCDVSHPTFMHSDFHLLTYDGSWANPLYAKEAHRILEQVTATAEMAVAGIELQVRTIYQECVPLLVEEIDGHS